MARAFEELAKTVGTLYGRKYVVFFSEGFDATFEPPPGLAPGEYTLLVTLTDGAGGARSSAAAITVGEVPPGGTR